MATFNGHKNWAHWNVALHIGNDEGLYRLALECIRTTSNRDAAAEAFMSSMGTDLTPDGARFTKSSVRAAMVDMPKAGG